tara:strand:- start:1006 stop:1176 length:171 start_codon:yes stop_codon:yes gene_type:complete
MKLTPITYEEIMQEAYDDYCGDAEDALYFEEWLATDDARGRIDRFCKLLGFGEGND